MIGKGLRAGGGRHPSRWLDARGRHGADLIVVGTRR